MLLFHGFYSVQFSSISYSSEILLVVNRAVVLLHSVHSGHYIFPVSCCMFKTEAHSWDGILSIYPHTHKRRVTHSAAWRAFPWAALETDVSRQSTVCLFFFPAWSSKLGLSQPCSLGGVIPLCADNIRLTCNHRRCRHLHPGANQIHPAAGLLSGLEATQWKD